MTTKLRAVNFKRVFLLVFLVVYGTACVKEKLPVGVLTKEAFSSVLVDVYLAQSRLTATLVSRDSSDKLFKPFEEKLLKSKNITDSSMKITYQYYLNHPKELEEIYDSVIDTLSLREQRAKPAEVKK